MKDIIVLVIMILLSILVISALTFLLNIVLVSVGLSALKWWTVAMLIVAIRIIKYLVS